MCKGGDRIKFLAQCAAHQQIPYISYQNDEDHLNIRRIRQNHGEFGVLPCGGMVQHTGQKSLKGV